MEIDSCIRARKIRHTLQDLRVKLDDSMDELDAWDQFLSAKENDSLHSTKIFCPLSLFTFLVRILITASPCVTLTELDLAILQSTGQRFTHHYKNWKRLVLSIESQRFLEQNCCNDNAENSFLSFLLQFPNIFEIITLRTTKNPDHIGVTLKSSTPLEGATEFLNYMRKRVFTLRGGGSENENLHISTKRLFPSFSVVSASSQILDHLRVPLRYGYISSFNDVSGVNTIACPHLPSLGEVSAQIWRGEIDAKELLLLLENLDSDYKGGNEVNSDTRTSVYLAQYEDLLINIELSSFRNSPFITNCFRNLDFENEKKLKISKSSEVFKNMLLPRQAVQCFRLSSTPLAVLRSYRLHPHFQKTKSFSQNSLSWSHQLRPNAVLCRYELHGTCNDPECESQHISDCKMTSKRTKKQLESYKSFQIFENENKNSDVVERKLNVLLQLPAPSLSATAFSSGIEGVQIECLVGIDGSSDHGGNWTISTLEKSEKKEKKTNFIKLQNVEISQCGTEFYEDRKMKVKSFLGISNLSKSMNQKKIDPIVDTNDDDEESGFIPLDDDANCESNDKTSTTGVEESKESKNSLIQAFNILCMTSKHSKFSKLTTFDSIESDYTGRKKIEIVCEILRLYVHENDLNLNSEFYFNRRDLALEILSNAIQENDKLQHQQASPDLWTFYLTLFIARCREINDLNVALTMIEHGLQRLPYCWLIWQFYIDIIDESDCGFLRSKNCRLRALKTFIEMKECENEFHLKSYCIANLILSLSRLMWISGYEETSILSLELIFEKNESFRESSKSQWMYNDVYIKRFHSQCLNQQGMEKIEKEDFYKLYCKSREFLSYTHSSELAIYAAESIIYGTAPRMKTVTFDSENVQLFPLPILRCENLQEVSAVEQIPNKMNFDENMGKFCDAEDAELYIKVDETEIKEDEKIVSDELNSNFKVDGVKVDKFFHNSYDKNETISHDEENDNENENSDDNFLDTFQMEEDGKSSEEELQNLVRAVKIIESHFWNITNQMTSPKTYKREIVALALSIIECYQKLSKISSQHSGDKCRSFCQYTLRLVGPVPTLLMKYAIVEIEFTGDSSIVDKIFQRSVEKDTGNGCILYAVCTYWLNHNQMDLAVTSLADFLIELQKKKSQGEKDENFEFEKISASPNTNYKIRLAKLLVSLVIPNLNLERPHETLCVALFASLTIGSDAGIAIIDTVLEVVDFENTNFQKENFYLLQMEKLFLLIGKKKHKSIENCLAKGISSSVITSKETLILFVNRCSLSKIFFPNDDKNKNDCAKCQLIQKALIHLNMKFPSTSGDRFAINAVHAVARQTSLASRGSTYLRNAKRLAMERLNINSFNRNFPHLKLFTIAVACFIREGQHQRARHIIKDVLREHRKWQEGWEILVELEILLSRSEACQRTLIAAIATFPLHSKFWEKIILNEICFGALDCALSYNEERKHVMEEYEKRSIQIGKGISQRQVHIEFANFADRISNWALSNENDDDALIFSPKKVNIRKQMTWGRSPYKYDSKFGFSLSKKYRSKSISRGYRFNTLSRTIWKKKRKRNPSSSSSWRKKRRKMHGNKSYVKKGNFRYSHRGRGGGFARRKLRRKIGGRQRK
eukprot:g2676.t1